MKVAIVGSGANGASIGADLTRAGVDVVLLEQWPEHVEAMREHGLRINMPNETFQLPVRTYHLCEVATFTEQFDVVLILVKAYDTRWAAQLIEPYLKPTGLVAGVQNGMTTDTIASVVGPSRTIGCVIEISSGMFEPGVVERHSPPSRSWFAVGGIHPDALGREAEVTNLLMHAGTVDVVDDIRGTKWMKLISNATTLVLTAILDISVIEAATTPGVRDLMLRAGQEALDAGALQGLDLLPIFGLTPNDLNRSDRLVELLLDTLCAGFVLPQTMTTVVHDWSKGRRSEVDDINGLVVAEHLRHGSSAPVNAALVEIAHRIERRDLAPGAENLKLLQDLVQDGFVPTPRLR